MANLANVLKQEISDAVDSQLRKALSDIDKALKDIQRDLDALQPFLALAGAAPRRQTRAKTGGRKAVTRKAPVRRATGQRTARKASAEASSVEASNAGAERKDNSRFSAAGLKAHRKSIDLSAGEYGRLLGVSALSIYNWEGGKAKPRPASIVELAKIKKMGKREAQELLEQKRREKLEG
ncbi:MAG: helix-turn-helix transcriptional regulator [Ectothiorhodospiraceae bacterium AqS1]|nr:helix-turn-helix transcriptional regulator [Ectothiorhodospiraceae bacterium AqS1]